MKRAAVDPKVAVALTRRSTLRQDLTHEAQRDAISAWAAREGVTVVAWHSDDVSGGDDIEDCPGLLAAIADIPTLHAGVLVVAKRDRLHRDTLKAGLIHVMVERQGAKIISAAGEGNGDEPGDILLRSVIDIFAQHERLMISSRTRIALAIKAKRGEALGCVQFGYRKVACGPEQTRGGVVRKTGMLVADPQEQAAITAALELRAAGVSFGQIAVELEKRGMLSREGTRIAKSTLCRAIKRANKAAKAA